MGLIPKSVTPVSASIAAALVGIVWFACCDGESQVEFDTTSIEKEIWTHSSSAVAHERSVGDDVSFRAHPIVNSSTDISGNFPVLANECALKYSAPSGDGWLDNSEHPCDESDEAIRRAEFSLHGERFPSDNDELEALASIDEDGNEVATEAAELPELPDQRPQSELERDARIEFLQDVNQNGFANGVRDKLAKYAIWDLDDDFLGCVSSESSRSVNYAQERSRLQCERSQENEGDLEQFTTSLSNTLENVEAQIAAFPPPHPAASQVISNNQIQWASLSCSPTHSSSPVNSGGTVDVRISSRMSTIVPISLLAGERMVADLGSRSGDSYLELWDSTCTRRLAVDDDGGPGSDSRLSFTASSAGTYHFITKAYGNNTSAYDAVLSVGSDMPDMTPEQRAGYNTYVADISSLLTRIDERDGDAKTLGRNTDSYNNSSDQDACLDDSMMSDNDYAIINTNAFDSATSTCSSWIDSLV